MNDELKALLRQQATIYHCADFITDDPVQFPHRYTSKQDIEISGLLTAILSFGLRKQILKKAEELDRIMQGQPYRYVKEQKWKKDFPSERMDSFYRMLSYSQLHFYFEKLHSAYSQYDSLEEALGTYEGNPMERLCKFLDVSHKSPQKKLNMFLRWMIRPKGPVDFGLWTSFHSQDLIIPFDTHVCRISHEIGLINKPAFSLGNAIRVTQALKEVFPNDPCLGDFALFGYGVNHKK